MVYVTRFAPTPSGAMHLGHARTALVAWLRARTASGEIVMRIEDLDPPRVKKGSEASILHDHEWLGLDWDRGPIHQSDRFDRYELALAALGDRVFDCTCTRKELQAAAGRAPHGDVQLYPGTCRLAPSDPSRRAAKRFRIDDAPPFRDALVGDVSFPVGDFVVRRSDGLWAYQLAVVVDDHEMGITEVVRGDDLLSSTPLQIALYDALGWTPPSWLHVPLVLGADGERLAKRHGSISVSDYRNAGWSRESLLGVLAASLGLQEDMRPVGLDELRAGFALESLARSPVQLPGPAETPTVDRPSEHE